MVPRGLLAAARAPPLLPEDAWLICSADPARSSYLPLSSATLDKLICAPLSLALLLLFLRVCLVTLALTLSLPPSSWALTMQQLTAISHARINTHARSHARIQLAVIYMANGPQIDVNLLRILRVFRVLRVFNKVQRRADEV